MMKRSAHLNITILFSVLLCALGSSSFAKDSSGEISNEAAHNCANIVKKVVVVFDAESTGIPLAAHLHSKGYDVYLGVSNEYRDRIVDSGLGDIVKDTIYEDEIERFVQINPVHFYSGSDSGIYPMDFFNKYFNLRGNDPATSKLRRHKAVQSKAIRDAGLAAMVEVEGKNYADVEEFVNVELQNWAKGIHVDDQTPYAQPVMFKVPEGVSAVGQKVCYTPAELKTAIEQYVGKPNFWGSITESFLVQRYMDSKIFDEYIVNFVGSDGVTLNKPVIYKYRKTKIPGERDRTLNQVRELMPWNGDVQSKLASYMKQVLPVIGMQNGPSHAEVWMRKDGTGSPILNEVAGGRPGGSTGQLAEVNRLATGFDEIDAITLAAHEPDKFLELNTYEYSNGPKDKNSGETKRFGFTPAVIVLINSKDGTRNISHAMEQKIMALPAAYKKVIWSKMVPEGSQIFTQDLETQVGKVILMDANPQVLEQSLQAYLQMEDDGALYEKESSSHQENSLRDSENSGFDISNMGLETAAQ